MQPGQRTAVYEPEPAFCTIAASRAIQNNIVKAPLKHSSNVSTLSSSSSTTTAAANAATAAVAVLASLRQQHGLVPNMDSNQQQSQLAQESQATATSRRLIFKCCMTCMTQLLQNVELQSTAFWYLHLEVAAFGHVQLKHATFCDGSMHCSSQGDHC